MTGYGTWGDTDATSNTAQMDTELGGVLLGFDYNLGERWRLGILGGYNHTRVIQRARHLPARPILGWSVCMVG